MKASRTSIETVTGQLLDFANPTMEMVSVESIAWGLSRQPRFCGQTIGSIPYSVAQHSVYVMDVVEQVMTLNSSLNRMMFSTASQRTKDFLSCSSSIEKYRSIAKRFGLFHDGSEAFLCDIPTPAKRLPGLMEAYSAVESKLMTAIHERVGLTIWLGIPEIAEIVHWADQYALAVEARHLVSSRGESEEWAFLMTPISEHVLLWPAPASSLEAYGVFMDSYDELLRSDR